MLLRFVFMNSCEIFNSGAVKLKFWLGLLYFCEPLKGHKQRLFAYCHMAIHSID